MIKWSAFHPWNRGSKFTIVKLSEKRLHLEQIRRVACLKTIQRKWFAGTVRNLSMVVLVRTHKSGFGNSGLLFKNHWSLVKSRLTLVQRKISQRLSNTLPSFSAHSNLKAVGEWSYYHFALITVIMNDFQRRLDTTYFLRIYLYSIDHFFYVPCSFKT